MYDRDSQTLRRDEEQLRLAAVDKAERWTEGQAARLDTTPEEILEAVRCGWLPVQIEGVSSKHALEGHPPPLEDVSEWIDILIAKRTAAKARAKATGMALAYREEKNRAS